MRDVIMNIITVKGDKMKITVKETDTISYLIVRIKSQGLNSFKDIKKLVWEGKELDESKTLSESNIPNKATLICVGCLSGKSDKSDKSDKSEENKMNYYNDNGFNSESTIGFCMEDVVNTFLSHDLIVKFKEDLLSTIIPEAQEAQEAQGFQNKFSSKYLQPVEAYGGGDKKTKKKKTKKKKTKKRKTKKRKTKKRKTKKRKKLKGGSGTQTSDLWSDVSQAQVILDDIQNIISGKEYQAEIDESDELFILRLLYVCKFPHDSPAFLRFLKEKCIKDGREWAPTLEIGKSFYNKNGLTAIDILIWRLWTGDLYSPLNLKIRTEGPTGPVISHLSAMCKQNNFSTQMPLPLPVGSGGIQHHSLYRGVCEIGEHFWLEENKLLHFNEKWGNEQMSQSERGLKDEFVLYEPSFIATSDNKSRTMDVFLGGLGEGEYFTKELVVPDATAQGEIMSFYDEGSIYYVSIPEGKKKGDHFLAIIEGVPQTLLESEYKVLFNINGSIKVDVEYTVFNEDVVPTTIPEMQHYSAFGVDESEYLLDHGGCLVTECVDGNKWTEEKFLLDCDVDYDEMEAYFIKRGDPPLSRHDRARLMLLPLAKREVKYTSITFKYLPSGEILRYILSRCKSILFEEIKSKFPGELSPAAKSIINDELVALFDGKLDEFEEVLRGLSGMPHKMGRFIKNDEISAEIYKKEAMSRVTNAVGRTTDFEMDPEHLEMQARSMEAILFENSLITLNGHGSYNKDLTVIPEGIEILVPFKGGTGTLYTTEHNPDITYEQVLYGKTKTFDYVRRNEETGEDECTGWKLYLPGEQINDMKFSPLFDYIPLEIQAGMVSTQRGEIYKCQPWASEGSEGFKDSDRWLFYIATDKDLKPVGGDQEYRGLHSLPDTHDHAIKIKILDGDEIKLSEIMLTLRERLSRMPGAYKTEPAGVAGARGNYHNLMQLSKSLGVSALPMLSGYLTILQNMMSESGLLGNKHVVPEPIRLIIFTCNAQDEDDDTPPSVPDAGHFIIDSEEKLFQRNSLYDEYLTLAKEKEGQRQATRTPEPEPGVFSEAFTEAVEAKYARLQRILKLNGQITEQEG